MHEDPSIPILSVTEFNTMVNDILTECRVWVKGEVSGYRVSQNKWVTFDLKDEGSRVNCFMTVYQLDQVLEDGIEVKVFGSPRIYVPYGKYSFTVQRIEPVGEGALRRAFELTKAKLETEGVFDPIHKKQLPRFPKTIGIVSSPEAAAYTDFLRIVQNRWSGIELILRPSLVQGNEAPAQIVAAIEWFNRYHPVEVLVVTRGGGSLEDLQAFNSEQVCRAIFASRIPVICAVGHERDHTLAELAADVRASTPSNAAERAVPDKKEILRSLHTMSKSLEATVLSRVLDYRWQAKEILSRLDRSLQGRLASFRQAEHDLQLAFEPFYQRMVALGSNLPRLQKELEKAPILLLKRWSDQIRQQEKLLRSYSPKGVLKRGYAIIRRGNGQLLSSVKQVKIGEVLQTELADGKLTAEVLSKGKGIVENKTLF